MPGEKQEQQKRRRSAAATATRTQLRKTNPLFLCRDVGRGEDENDADILHLLAESAKLPVMAEGWVPEASPVQSATVYWTKRAVEPGGCTLSGADFHRLSGSSRTATRTISWSCQRLTFPRIPFLYRGQSKTMCIIDIVHPSTIATTKYSPTTMRLSFTLRRAFEKGSLPWTNR